MFVDFAAMLADGLRNVWHMGAQRWYMVGVTLADGWGNLGRWLRKRWQVVGATLVGGYGNVGTVYAVDVGPT